MSQSNGNGTRPVWSCKAGGVSAAVFENERVTGGKKFVTRNVVVERCFKDRNGKWQRTSSFNEQDLVRLRLVVEKSIECLFSGERESVGEEGVDLSEPVRAPSFSPRLSFSGVDLVGGVT